MTDVRHVKIPEIVVPGKRLGRHVQHDPRSLLPEYLAPEAPKIISTVHTAKGLPLDQGDVGSCTAEALIGALDSTPNLPLRNNPFGQKVALDLYKLETEMEGQPYPEFDPGGTGVMVCKAAKRKGLIHSYATAVGITHALKSLVLRPVITGVNWYEGFDTPSSAGLVKIAGEVRGGHEVVVEEIDVPHKLVWLYNSWGPSYGKKGRFCMAWSTWDRLLHEDGDVTVPLR